MFLKTVAVLILLVALGIAYKLWTPQPLLGSQHHESKAEDAVRAALQAAYKVERGTDKPWGGRCVELSMPTESRQWLCRIKEESDEHALLFFACTTQQCTSITTEDAVAKTKQAL